MNYFDVLTSHDWIGTGGKPWYFVTTVEARNEVAARRKATAKMSEFFRRNGRTELSSVVHGVGACGCYKQFVGKYVGQFIDEAFPNGE
jgi:hypothetical protein